jgi:hypothetical protein
MQALKLDAGMLQAIHAGVLDSLSNVWGETGQINSLDHWLLDDVRLVELAPAWLPLMED